MEKITIDVLKADIIKGRRESVSSCAVARAVERKGLKDVSVDGRAVSFTKEGKHFTVNLPLRVRTWINKFDNATNLKVELAPISFSFQIKEAKVNA